MCGFVGAIGTDLRADDLKSSLHTIRHRGPDAQQLFAVESFCLAACRLAIRPPFDDSPIHLSSSRALVLNGEVYQIETLSEAGGAAAGQKTDTHLLDEALERHGVSLLPKLSGLFSFCLWDGHEVLLARDRFGIKPLYFAHFRGGVVFASEMKALLALPGFSRDPDPDVLSAFSVVGHNVLPGRTPFHNIQSLMPGHWMSYSPTAGLLEQRFAAIPGVPLAGQGLTPDPADCGKQTEALLSASIRRTVLHDPQPKAVFFSGGIDSSLLLDIARHEAPVTAYVLSDSDDADDRAEAARVATALNVPLREHRIDELSLAREVVHYAWHFEHPVAGGAFDTFGGVAFHALARVIAKDFKVAFTGEGADELFLGYHRLHMDPALFLQPLRGRERLMTPAIRDWLFSHHLLGDEEPAARRAVRELALCQGLFEYHLPSVDRSGMAFGMEIRPPYLDDDLATWAATLDEGVLVDRIRKWTKVPLREIAKRRFLGPGTERVWLRRKWAMPSAVQVSARRLLELLGLSVEASQGSHLPGLEDVNGLLSDLFWYLHIDPGCSDPPDLSLLEFADQVWQRRRTR